MRTLFTLLIALLTVGSATAQQCSQVIVTTIGGSFANEVGWTIENLEWQNGEQYALSPGLLTQGDALTEVYCFEPGCYLLEMSDTFGDGWNGATITIQSEQEGYELTTTLENGDYGALLLEIFPSESCDLDSVIFEGCTDPTAINYMPIATVDDGSCVYQQIYGCTDPQADNYNPNATADDGSCTYVGACEGGVIADLYICTFSNDEYVAIEVISDQGDTIYANYGTWTSPIMHIDVCLLEGTCYTVNMMNLGGWTQTGWYNGYWWVNVGGMQIATDMLDYDLAFETTVFSIDGTCGPIYGCTDANATNYDPDATNDDGSCFYPIPNDLCADATPIVPGNFVVFNVGATENEGYYGDCWGFGSGEEENSSVWFSFTTPDYPARITFEALYNGNNTTLNDTQFALFAECGGEMIACDGNSGQGLLSMFDFQCGELEENTTYLLMVDGYAGQMGTCLVEYTVTDFCDDPIFGCTDPSAINYNAAANMEDGSCVYAPDSCDASLVSFVLNTQMWGNEISFTLNDDSGDVVASFNGFDTNGSYVVFACVTPGCYTLTLEDSFGDGWNGAELSILLDGDVVLEGITLPSGNIGSATFGVLTDDCDTEVSILGCTDPAALNYNPIATIDDGSCFYGQDTTFCQASFELVEVDIDGNMMYILNTSTGEFLNYEWDFGDGTTSTEQFPFHTYTADGTYTICLVVYNAVCEDVYCMDVTYEFPPTQNGAVIDGEWHINVIEPGVTALTETSFDALGMSVFPNPASDRLTMTLDTDDIEGLRYELVDMSGRVMMAEPLLRTTMDIDIATYAEGMYLLRIIGANGMQTRTVQVIR